MKTREWREAYRAVAWTELLSKSEMRFLFPDSDVWTERWYGMAKSLVAIRAPDAPAGRTV